MGKNMNKLYNRLHINFDKPDKAKGLCRFMSSHTSHTFQGDKVVYVYILYNRSKPKRIIQMYNFIGYKSYIETTLQDKCNKNTGMTVYREVTLNSKRYNLPVSFDSAMIDKNTVLGMTKVVPVHTNSI